MKRTMDKLTIAIWPAQSRTEISLPKDEQSQRPFETATERDAALAPETHVADKLIELVVAPDPCPLYDSRLTLDDSCHSFHRASNRSALNKTVGFSINPFR